MSHPITPVIKDQAFQYLLNNSQIGIPERLLIATICGFEINRDCAYSHHPVLGQQLRNCMHFLTTIPAARAFLPKCSELSPCWSALVDDWENLETFVLKNILDKSTNPEVFRKQLQKKLDAVITQGYINNK